MYNRFSYNCAPAPSYPGGQMHASWPQSYGLTQPPPREAFWMPSRPHFSPEQRWSNERSRFPLPGRNRYNNMSSNTPQQHGYYQRNHHQHGYRPQQQQLGSNYGYSSRNDNHSHRFSAQPKTALKPAQRPERQQKPEHKAKDTSGGDGSCHCEPCDRDFASNDALAAHQKSHVTCEEPGCAFVAGSKAVKLHFIQNHAEGKYRIKLETPDDIARWREERKRSYPTLSNIEAKLQKTEFRQERGARLETRQFRYRGGDRGSHRNSGHRGFSRADPGDQNYDARDSLPRDELGSESVSKPGDVVNVDGCCSGRLDVNENIPCSTSDLSANVKDLAHKDITPVSQHLECPPAAPASAMCEGNSVVRPNEENDGAEDGEVRSCSEDERGPSATTACAVAKKSGANERTWETRKKASVKKNASTGRGRVTLLEMLLAKEIRHERNVVLQCIRYIVSKNFFDGVTSE